MSTQTEALSVVDTLKMALEALDQLTNAADTFSVSGVYFNEEVWAKKCLSDAYFAITAIEQALAQPEQPKVRTGNCLLVGVCASEGHKIQKAQPEQEPVAHDGAATEKGARYQADQNLRALLRYTENFYGVAIKHGMKAGETANAIAHIEKAGKALHELIHAWAGVAETRATSPQLESVAWGADQAYAEGRGDYEVAQIRTKKTGWKLFGELSPKEQAYWVAKAAFDRATISPQRKQVPPSAYESLLRDMTTIAAKEVPNGCSVSDFARHALADAELREHDTPPQRKPLTDEQVAEIYTNTKGLDFYLNFARAIEAAHGIVEEKNT